MSSATPHDDGDGRLDHRTRRGSAERFVYGRLSDEALSRMTDDEVEATLIEVLGIVLWTRAGSCSRLGDGASAGTVEQGAAVVIALP